MHIGTLKVLHTSGQIDIIRQKLVKITRKDIEHGMTENVIKTLVMRHQKIIFFSNNIEALFSNIALMQFVSNTLVICCLGFLIVIVSRLKCSNFLYIQNISWILVHQCSERNSYATEVCVILHCYQHGIIHILLCRRTPYYESQYNVSQLNAILCFTIKNNYIFQSRMIGDAVYESHWYDLTPTQNHGLLLMIVRSQKHLMLTVGKVMDLSLMQFSSVRI